MNAEFYINLTKMKTLQNASIIESIKDIYFKSEQKAQFESCGKITDSQKEIFFENGSVRCTKVSDGIIVEASAVGTKNLYGVVAVVSKETSIDDAITAGKCALDNPVIMEGLIDSFKQKLKKFASVAALSIAPFLVACAGGGHQPTLDQTAILNADTIPEMVQAFSQKIREEANNVQNYDVTKTPSEVSTLDDVEFCQWLTQEHGVAAIPLSVFCADPFPHKLIRLCFAKKESTLLAAAERLRQL